MRSFARSPIADRGEVSEAERQAFFDAGYGEAQALELLLGLTVKLMRNDTTAIAGTPLDEPVQRLAWKKPVIAMRDC